MGNSITRRVSFEDVEYAQKGHALLISVLAENEQSVLIEGTVPLEDEVEEVEHAIASKRAIIIYGKNANDEKVYVKYDQLVKLGGRPYIYSGGNVRVAAVARRVWGPHQNHGAHPRHFEISTL